MYKVNDNTVEGEDESLRYAEGADEVEGTRSRLTWT